MTRQLTLLSLAPTVWFLASATSAFGLDDALPTHPIDNGWRRFGDTPQTPAKPNSASKQRANGRENYSAAVSTPSRTSTSAAARIGTVGDGPPQATMLYYQPSEPKAQPVFATKPAVADSKPVAAEPETQGIARVVEYTERDIIPLRTRLRYTTVIALPAGEQIMDFVIGDKDNWVVNGATNLAYVKPAKAAATTNLNLVSTRGIVYSFVLAEVGDGIPDLKLFVKPQGEEIKLALSSPAKYVPVERIDEYRQQADAARNQANVAQQAAQKSIESQVSAFKNTYPSSVHFEYRFERGKKPFGVTEIFHDGKFTYIKAKTEETPTLYEVKDGTPNLVNFEYRDGTYVVGKVLESGYLAIGKKRFAFTREQ